jgi:4,5-dihydroxyphthalate decarboxylase
MHIIVIKRDIYEKAPWVAVSLYKAFARAKAVGMRRLEYGATLFCSLPWLGVNLQEVRKQMGKDPFQYGVEENRKVLGTLLEYSFEQGLISQRLKVEELFVPETLSGVDLTEI